MLNAFPNLRHSAEREFIERCVAVLGRLGHRACSALTSDDVIAFNPDVVIVTHEFVAKTTDHFTAGLLWSPTQFYQDDEARLKAIRSWDLVVPINAATRRLARSLHFPLRHTSAVSDLDFFPSAPRTELPLPDTSKLGLAYVGAHWDGQRHRQLLEELAKVTDLHVYGPAKTWEFLPGNYRGAIPFDGTSLVQTLNRHGIVLALHKHEHVEEETPSMRVFEACAARCAVITERMPGFVQLFGDDLHYIDRSLSPRRLARDIADIVTGYQAQPALFEQRVARLQDVFVARASLERLLTALLDDVVVRRAAARALSPGLRREPDPDLVSGLDADPSPEVAVIIRCGARPLAVLARAVASVAAQTHARVGLILVRFAPMEGFDAWLQSVRASGRFRFVQEVSAPGNGVRSAAWWAGLRAVHSDLQSDAFCMLDDDDEWFSDHLASLVAVLGRDAAYDVAYSGVVKQEEDGRWLNEHERFKGDLQQEVQERRALQFMDDFDLDRLLRFDNFIQSNTWLARRGVLSAEVLDDPELEVSEDVYFYLLLASRHRFRFSGRVSAIWNWRSNAGDNSMMAVSQQGWARCGARVVQRLAHLQFPGEFLGSRVVGTGRMAPQAVRSARQRHAPGDAAQRDALPKFLLRRLLKAASGQRSFLSAADPIPFDPAEVVSSIDFTSGHLPPAITNVRGLSDFEGWGCWTDGPTLTLEFRTPLPLQFTLHLIGHAFESNHDLPITVAVGGHEASLKMSARLRASRYTLALHNPDGARTLVFRIPQARSPASQHARSRETRRLGIGLVRLDIISR